MRKKWILAVIFAIIMTMAAGCTPLTPKQVLQEAFTKSESVKSYAFDVGLAVSLESMDPIKDPNAEMILSFLRDAKLTVTGKYDETKKRLDMNLNVASSGGDMKMSLDIPIIADGDKLYVKVPQIPFYPLPKEIVGKYVTMDLKDLQKNSSIKANEKETNIEDARSFMKDVVGIFVDDFGGTEFVTELKKDAIPADVKDAKHVVQFKVTDATLEKAANLLVKTTLPKVLDLLSQDKYAKAFAMAPEDIKKSLEGLNKADLSPEKFAEMRKTFTLNEASYIIGIDQDNYISNQQFGIDAVVKDPTDLNMHIKAKLSMNMSDIGKEQQFSPVPQDKDIIDSKKLFDGTLNSSNGLRN